MEHLLKRLDRFENLEEGILFGRVGEETEHSPRRSDKFHNLERQEWPRQMLIGQAHPTCAGSEPRLSSQV